MIDDSLVGRNVLAFRKHRTQHDLASLMRERGWKWSQSTVWSIEKGERPLRLGEAVDLADIFGVRVERLISEDNALDAWVAKSGQVLRRKQELSTATMELAADIVKLRTEARRMQRNMPTDDDVDATGDEGAAVRGRQYSNLDSALEMNYPALLARMIQTFEAGEENVDGERPEAS